MFLDSKHVLKLYLKPSRKNPKKNFLPLCSELVWLKILHLSIKDHKKIKKPKIFFEGQTQSPKPQISKSYNFPPVVDNLELYQTMVKAINLSLKATVESYTGQTCNLVSWIRFFKNFAPPI